MWFCLVNGKNNSTPDLNNCLFYIGSFAIHDLHNLPYSTKNQ
jgi:hypothetical protein